MVRSAVVFVVLAALAVPASAQVIHRDPPPKADAPKADAPKADAPKADAPKADAKKSGGDDDILAPEGAKAEATEQAKPKQFTVGLVGLVPVGDAGKTLADKATAGLLKELGAGHVFGTNALAVDVKGAAASPGTDAAAAKQALDQGNGALEKAKAALDKLKFGLAKKAFHVALDDFEKAAPVLSDPEPLIACRLGLAEVAAREGQDNEAAVQLSYAAALNPERSLDKKHYPNAFITTFLKQRDKLLADKRGSIVVDESGAGASVEIDGRQIQGAPATITNVPQGRHLVRAVREGLPSFGAVVEVKPDATVTVSPGFVAKDGHSYVDDLQNNRLTPDAATAIAAAAKAAGEKAGVVGVVEKTDTGANVQLVLVDAGGAGMEKLPELAFTGDLLDIGIETLKARDAIEAAIGPDGKPVWSKDPLATLIEGAKAGAGAQMATVALRYDVQPLRGSSGGGGHRVVEGGGNQLAFSDADGGHKVLSAGKSGTRLRLDDEEDPYADHHASTSGGNTTTPDPDAPITEQPWFWPTVVGGGAGAVVVLGGAALVGLVAAKVVPDPRPTNGAQIHVTP